jgi:hypothetical protein
MDPISYINLGVYHIYEPWKAQWDGDEEGQRSAPVLINSELNGYISTPKNVTYHAIPISIAALGSIQGGDIHVSALDQPVIDDHDGSNRTQDDRVPRHEG